MQFKCRFAPQHRVEMLGEASRHTMQDSPRAFFRASEMRASVSGGGPEDWGRALFRAPREGRDTRGAAPPEPAPPAIPEAPAAPEKELAPGVSREERRMWEEGPAVG